MNQNFDVLIVGGGIVGLAAALAMAQQEFSVAIIDAGALDTSLGKPEARVYAINQASENLLRELGVWSKIDDAYSSPYRHMHVWDAASHACIDFDSRMIGASTLGHIVEESALKHALLQIIKNTPLISLFPNHCVKTVNETQDKISLGSAQMTWEGQLLMVADGANSPCRERLKVKLTSWPYHQNALVALISTEKPHQETAYQIFNPDGPLAFLPLSNPKLCSIVWSTSISRAKQLMACSEEQFNEELAKAFGKKLGSVQLEGQRYQFPLLMRHAKQYSGSRWLLLGDAAHTIHPLAGLGLNLGLADLTTWLNYLHEANNHLTSKKALGAYQRQRKHAVWQIIAMMDALKALFTNPLSPIIALRGFALSRVNQLHFLKRVLITQASGDIKLL